MACEVNNKEINSQCAELLVRPTYNELRMYNIFHLNVSRYCRRSNNVSVIV